MLVVERDLVDLVEGDRADLEHLDGGDPLGHDHVAAGLVGLAPRVGAVLLGGGVVVFRGDRAGVKADIHDAVGPVLLGELDRAAVWGFPVLVDEALGGGGIVGQGDGLHTCSLVCGDRWRRNRRQVYYIKLARKS